MANSYELDERGYGMCRCCRKKLSIGDLNSCLYCDRWVCKSCAIKSKRWYYVKKMDTINRDFLVS